MSLLEDRIYKEYMTFFEKAERERRWSVFQDIPWDQCNPRLAPAVADVVESFCAVELYLPDYTSKILPVVRHSRGRTWFYANWGYEESKHSLVLMQYLVKSGKRTEEQIADLQKRIFDKKWNLPFTTPRQMTFYGCVQEMATFVIYVKQEQRAKEIGDECLATIFRFNARDEIAHCRFYEDVVKVLLEEDRPGTLSDIAHVAKHFQMPGVGIVPNYEDRIKIMREEGKVDRAIFLQKVFFPVLKYLGVTRQELQEAAYNDRHRAAPTATPNATASAPAAE